MQRTIEHSGVLVDRVVILGAGISGHTAALHLQRQLKSKVDVVVVSPNSNWNWIPSNIWVGVGKMTKDQVTFPLAPIYKRKHIGFRQAKAVAIHPRVAPEPRRAMSTSSTQTRPEPVRRNNSPTTTSSWRLDRS